jgi:hypothetical protein
MNDDLFDYQRRVSEIAHQLWLQEGRPQDRGVEHWNRAEEMLAAEEAARRLLPDFFPAAAA